jgi:hypothetical protein
MSYATVKHLFRIRLFNRAQSHGKVELGDVMHVSVLYVLHQTLCASAHMIQQ